MTKEETMNSPLPADTSNVVRVIQVSQEDVLKFADCLKTILYAVAKSVKDEKTLFAFSRCVDLEEFLRTNKIT